MTGSTIIYVLGLMAAIALLICAQFPLARILATIKDWNQVNILGGLAQYVRWKRNEIVIFEREGKVLTELLEKDMKDKQGGARFIYAVRGEAIRGRVGLGLHSFTWKDEVDIQEVIPCSIEVNVWWAVNSSKVADYFFRNDLENSPHVKKEMAIQRAAESDLRKLTGARVRKAVSKADFQASLIEMLLLKQSEYRAVPGDNNRAADTLPGVANISANLERALQTELNAEKLDKEAQEYGLRVDRIEVQLIKWATEVQRPVLYMLLGRLKPEEAKSQAEANRIIADTQAESYARGLRVLADVLGIPVTQMRELLQHLPPGSNNTREELAKAIISEFKNLNPKPEPQAPETKIDEIEPPKDEHDGQESDGFEPPKDKHDS